MMEHVDVEFVSASGGGGCEKKGKLAGWVWEQDKNKRPSTVKFVDVC
jgi:hypothetical protein